jgi:hypothetical protein
VLDLTDFFPRDLSGQTLKPVFCSAAPQTRTLRSNSIETAIGISGGVETTHFQSLADSDFDHSRPCPFLPVREPQPLSCIYASLLNQTTRDSYTSSLAVDSVALGLNISEQSRRPPDQRLACPSGSPLARLRSEQTGSVSSKSSSLCQCLMVRFSSPHNGSYIVRTTPDAKNSLVLMVMVMHVVVRNKHRVPWETATSISIPERHNSRDIRSYLADNMNMHIRWGAGSLAGRICDTQCWHFGLQTYDSRLGRLDRRDDSTTTLQTSVSPVALGFAGNEFNLPKTRK